MKQDGQKLRLLSYQQHVIIAIIYLLRLRLFLFLFINMTKPEIIIFWGRFLSAKKQWWNLKYNLHKNAVKVHSHLLITTALKKKVNSENKTKTNCYQEIEKQKLSIIMSRAKESEPWFSLPSWTSSRGDMSILRGTRQKLLMTASLVKNAR